MIYGLNDSWPITIFPSIISTGTCSWCHDENVHFASSCRKFRRELAMTSAFSPFSFWNTASKGAVIKAVWEAAWGKSKRGRDGERAGESKKERIGKTSALLNISAALRYPVTKASALIKLCFLPQQHSARLFWHLNRMFYYSFPFIRRQPREDYSEITGYIMT